jgi:ferric-dicitrate binding protein FerR (iron transport regulator)
VTLPDLTNDSEGSDEGSNEVDWNLIARYLANELPAEDRQKFERWIAGDDQRLKEMAQLQRLWDHAGSLPSSSRMREMWNAVSRDMKAGANGTGGTVGVNAPSQSDGNVGDENAGDESAGDESAGSRCNYQERK